MQRRIWFLACLCAILAGGLASTLSAATPSLSVSPASVRAGGTVFKVWTTIPRSRRPGRYVITGRCGGGNLGFAVSLRVRIPA